MEMRYAVKERERFFVCIKSMVRWRVIYILSMMQKSFIFQGILGFGAESGWDIEWEIGLNF